MRKLSTECKLYGFEEYKLLNLPPSAFNPNNSGWISMYTYPDNPGYYIINNNLPVELQPDMYGYAIREIEVIQDHKELLATANKVFVHPACTLSRTMLSSKYKKSKNAWTAYIVVMPNTTIRGDVRILKTALFINEEAKIICRVRVEETDIENYINSLPMGTKVKDCASAEFKNKSSEYFAYDKDAAMNSELMFFGKLIHVPRSESHLFDILTNNLPLDKTVFENTILESLADETNKITLESLTSIYDMLESSDSDTVAAGLKALSMMDWMHYPNSVKYIISLLTNSYKVSYNNAFSSTPVKYMFNNLLNNRRRSNIWVRYDGSISKEDYDLFTQLVQYYDKENNTIGDLIKGYAFMRVNTDGVLVPNIKDND